MNFFAQILQVLQRIKQRGVDGNSNNISATNIKTENDVLTEMIEQSPNSAFPRAAANLQCAQQAGNDELIALCAFTYARAAQKYSPSPKFEEAITAYTLVIDRGIIVVGHEKIFALAQNNLGEVYSDLPTGDHESNLNRAITYYENASQIFTKAAYPSEFAWTQNNLGNVYSNLLGGDRTENLVRAITYYENASLIRTKAAYPREYAVTQNNLGLTYSDLPSGDREANLHRAIVYYKNALRVYTKAAYPEDYASTQSNLGVAYCNLPKGKVWYIYFFKNWYYLRRAVACYEKALQVYTETACSEDYANTQNNLGLAYSKLPSGNRETNLRRAITCYEHALRVYTETALPEDYANTQNNLGVAYNELPNGDRETNLRRAIACYEKALRVYTETALSEDYARTQNNLGLVYLDLSTGDQATNLCRAIACFENALRIYNETAFPQEFAAAQHNLGSIYRDLPIGDRNENLQYAIACFENALHVYTKTAFPQDYARTQNDLGAAYRHLQALDYLQQAGKVGKAGGKETVRDFEFEDNSEREVHFRRVAVDDVVLRKEPILKKAYQFVQGSQLFWENKLFLPILINYDPNAAYVRAMRNLQQAQQIGNDKLIMVCAYMVAFSAQKNRPYPDIDMAITVYQFAANKALKIKDNENYAVIQQNMGAAYQSLTTGNRETNLNQSITCFEEVLRICSETTSPHEHAGAQTNLGNTYLMLPTGDRAANVRRAIDCFENALRVYTMEQFPSEYAIIQNSLGGAYASLLNGNREDNLNCAIACFENALCVSTETTFSGEYARAQQNLGKTYFFLPTGNQEANMRRAIACFENALRIHTATDFPLDFAKIQVNLGATYRALPTGDRESNLRRAIDCFESSLCIYIKETFPYEYATTKNHLGMSYIELPTGDKNANLRLAIDCHTSAQCVLTEEAFPYEYAVTESLIGTAYEKLPIGNREANLHRAIACYENALRIFTESDFPQGYAEVQRNLGIAYQSLPIGNYGGNVRRAIDCYENALRIYTEMSFPYSFAWTQGCLGDAYQNLPTGDFGGNLHQAIACYKNALRIYTETTHPEKYARNQVNLGNVFIKLQTGDIGANLRQALRCYESALRIFPEIAFPAEYAATQHALGNLYRALLTGDREINLRRAIACFEKALRIYTEDAFPQNYALTQANLGGTYAQLLSREHTENLRRAIVCHENALRIYTRSNFPRDYAIIQGSLGIIYLQHHRLIEGNLRCAMTCFENAQHIYTESDFPLGYAMAQTGLGAAYSNLPNDDSMADLRRAITFYENALRIYSSETDFPQNYALLQHNLGNAYRRLQNDEHEENLHQAVVCFKNALRIRTAETSPLDNIETLFQLVLVYDSDVLHKEQHAYMLCEEAICVLETRVRAIASPATRRILAENQAKIYARMVSLCIRLGKTDEALLYMERGKSRTLVEMLHAAQLEPSEAVPEELRATFRQVREKLEQLDSLQQAGQEEAARDFEFDDDGERGVRFRRVVVDETAPREDIYRQRDDVHNAYQNLLVQIREKDEFFAATEQVAPLDLAELNGMIPEGTVFVECFSGYDGTYLFVLDGKTDVKENSLVLKDLTFTELFDTLATNDWLDPYYAYTGSSRIERQKKFQSWCDVIEGMSQLLAERFWFAEDEQGRSLNILVDRSGAKQIVFLPHSGLHLLPLHLIPLQPREGSKSSQGLRLIDKYDIAYAPSISLLSFALQREERELNDLFAVVNPDRSLLFADSEVCDIAEYFEEPQILRHNEALRETLLQQPIDADVAHFSCHGTFANGNPMLSGLLLTPMFRLTEQSFTTLEEKNLPQDILNSLKILENKEIIGEEEFLHTVKAQIGDEQSTRYKKLILKHSVLADDNLLSLQEIFARVKLRQGATVLLSACESGMVKLEQGDEFIGLPSGFLYAGASTVISSLWAVDDLSTSLLMQHWYENVMTHKMGRAAALRDAQQYVRDLAVCDIRSKIETLITDAEKRRDEADNDIKRQYYGRQRSLLTMQRGKYKNRPEDECPFQHPHYWGAFICTGNWK